MKYALVNGIKQEAKVSGERGICQGCGSETIAKCGEVKIHHWAHTNLDRCDFEREPETQWHREWKSHFKNQEVRHEKNGTICIADAVNSKGVSIEFQHSPIKAETIKAREMVHESVIWVVDCIGKDIRHGWVEDLAHDQLALKNKLNDELTDAIENLMLKDIMLLETKIINLVDEWLKQQQIVIKNIQEQSGRIIPFNAYWAIRKKLRQKYLNNSDVIALKKQIPISKKRYTFRWMRASKVWEKVKANIFLQVDEDTLLYVKDNTQIGEGECVKISKQGFLDRYAI